MFQLYLTGSPRVEQQPAECKRRRTDKTVSPVKGVKLHWQHMVGLDLGSRIWVRLGLQLQALHWRRYQTFQDLLHVDALFGLAHTNNRGGFELLCAGKLMQILSGILDLGRQCRYELICGICPPNTVIQVRSI